MTFSLIGKVAIVTGANRGFGLEVARKYVIAGASVVICARDYDLLEKASVDLRNLLWITEQRVEAIQVDVADKYSIEELIALTTCRLGRIDILVNNAGIYGPIGAIENIDWEKWINAIKINILGSVLMCRMVIPIMKAQKKGKIIQLSGGGATNPMPNFSAYAVSKAAIVRFTETLAEEVRTYGIDVNAIAPGALNTQMLEEVLAAGPDIVGQTFFDKSVKQKESGGTSLDKGADLALFLASERSDGISGKLISAVWDDWEKWPFNLDILNASDVYTLRRIVGKDRSLTWGDK